MQKEKAINYRVVVNARFLTQRLSGVQRFAMELALRLKEHYGNNIQFVSPHDITDDDGFKRLEALVIGERLGYMWEQIDLPRYLKTIGNPILINLCNMAPIFYSNKIVALHDVAYKAYSRAYSPKMKIAYNVLVPQILKYSKHVITVSDFSKQEIQKYYNVAKEKITVIYNAVGSNFHYIKDKDLSSSNYLLTVSSIGENKNFITSLKVYAEASKRINDLKFYVIGNTLKEAKYTKYKDYADNPNIYFLGSISDNELIKFYSNALAFIYPSIYEGFGIPPLEAQSCGCPVIASNSGPLPEILSSSALIFDPSDVDSMTNAVVQLYEDMSFRRQTIEIGQTNPKRFSWEKSAERMTDIIDRCLQ